MAQKYARLRERRATLRGGKEVKLEQLLDPALYKRSRMVIHKAGTVQHGANHRCALVITFRHGPVLGGWPEDFTDILDHAKARVGTRCTVEWDNPITLQRVPREIYLKAKAEGRIIKGAKIDT